MRWRFGANKSEQEAASDPISLMLAPGVSREVFLLLYSKLLGEKLAGAEIQSVEPFSLQFEGENGFTYTVGLENVWIQVHEEPSGARQLLEHHLATIARSGEPLVVEAANILPMIKGHGYVELLGERPDESIALEHYVADLWIAYCLRHEGSYSTLSWEELAGAGIDRKDLRRLALSNLQRTMPNVEFEIDQGVLVLEGAGELTATILLTDSVWNWLLQEGVIGDDFVVSTPVDHIVLVADGRAAEDVRALRRRAQEMFDELDHTVSPTVLRRTGSGWRLED